jgi:ATP-dependent Clp protease ATP-binding subunit ClpX
MLLNERSIVLMLDKLPILSSYSKSNEPSLKEIRSNITRDDLKKYGLIPEVLGRFSILSNLHPLEKSDLVNILKNKNGLFEEYKTLFK